MIKHKNTKKQGDAGLGDCIAYFTSIGATVLIPLTDSQDYDLVIDQGNGLKRVQVKTSTQVNKYGSYSVGLRLIGGTTGTVLKHFDATSVELLFVLCSNGSRYLIPTSEFNCKTGIDLGKKYEKFRLAV